MQSIQPTQPPADSIASAFPGQEEYEEQEPSVNQDWVDCVNIAEESLKELLLTTRPLRFDWENKWLRGDQYAHMLNNIDGYKEAFGMPKLAEKQHPENIYLEPQSKLLPLLCYHSRSSCLSGVASDSWHSGRRNKTYWLLII